jgi:hypothetical protein
MPSTLDSPPAAPPRTYTIKDLEALCRVGFRSISKWIEDGRFPAPLALPGRRKLWDAQKVDALFRGPKHAG